MELDGSQLQREGLTSYIVVTFKSPISMYRLELCFLEIETHPICINGQKPRCKKV